MTPLLVILGQHVKQKRLHVIIQSLVVQKQLRQQAQVLTVDLVHVAVHLEHGDVAAPVDLRRGRMPPRALVLVPFEHGFALRVLQAELAEEQLRQLGVLLRERARIPRLDLVLSELDGCGAPSLAGHRLRGGCEARHVGVHEFGLGDDGRRSYRLLPRLLEQLDVLVVHSGRQEGTSVFCNKRETLC